jgi:hypothetical protein
MKEGGYMKNVSVSKVPMPEDVAGMPAKFGKVTMLKDKFFVTVGRKKQEIPVDGIISKSDIRNFVNKDVIVVYSKTKQSDIVAIGLYGLLKEQIVLRKWITCYIPAPDIIRRINPDIRTTLINKMVSENIITQQLAERLRVV